MAGAVADALEGDDREERLVELLASAANTLAGGDLASIHPELAQRLVKALEETAKAIQRLEPISRRRSEARLWLSEFGLTPATAGKVIPAGAPEVADPLARFIEASA